MTLGKWFTIGGDFAPQGTLALSEDIFHCHTLGAEVDRGPGRQQNIPQCPDKVPFPTQQRIIWPKMSIGQTLTIPALKE